MRYAEIDNLWTVELSTLSNADRGRVFFERAKQVIEETLLDDKLRSVAVAGGRFRRNYLASKIESGRAAMNQNPRIKGLLAAIDGQLSIESDAVGVQEFDETLDQGQSYAELTLMVQELRGELIRKTTEASELKRLLRRRSAKRRAAS
ncbi:hypothetical protein J2W51_003916 [Tardiphaga robiniae]|uniref:hypothetical protein n=1 Tax=Tardiphaga robiniae TaxID=943830 RepID=UPI002865837E|nr:hypothetical protein [Tardiphaga robiniae]MDR6661330.1 hypothetical protein [Tardiphaga robiniae]